MHPDKINQPKSPPSLYDEYAETITALRKLMTETHHQAERGAGMILTHKQLIEWRVATEDVIILGDTILPLLKAYDEKNNAL